MEVMTNEDILIALLDFEVPVEAPRWLSAWEVGSFWVEVQESGSTVGFPVARDLGSRGVEVDVVVASSLDDVGSQVSHVDAVVVERPGEGGI